MLKKTMAVRPDYKIYVPNIPGDVRLTGWDREEVSAKTDGDVLDLILNDLTLTVTCDDDLILNVPRSASVQIDGVEGDAAVRMVAGSLSFGVISGDLAMREAGKLAIGTVEGDVSLHDVGGLAIEGVEGDLSLRGCNGPVSAGEISGDVSIQDVNGDVSLSSVEGDLYVRGVMGNLSAHSQGDASLYLEPREGAAVNVSAEDDVLLHLPANVNATLSLSADDADNINVKIPAAVTSGKNPRSVILGTGSASIKLQSEGDILVTSESSAWNDAAEFADFDGSWPLPADFSERINRQVQAATQRAARQAETAARRVEQKVRQQSRRFSFNWTPGRGAPVPPPSEPVSDEERMTILRMLQEKKISAEDAEKLLAALEGGK